VTYFVTCGIASVIPVLLIIVLGYQNTFYGRLGSIAAFNILIGAYLSYFTEAKRKDAFAIIAAYVPMPHSDLLSARPI
jgi:hypothetical protein